LPPRTLAGRRRDQLTKAPDYGAVRVAITVAQFYLSGMLQRTLPAGFIAPYLPTKTDRLPSGGQWLHEIKHGGFRVIARKDGPRVRLYSRPGNDFTRRFSLIVEALHRLRSRSCIIDGEAVPCDDNGVASFDLIRHHHHNNRVFLYAFDLIELNGDDMRRDPLEVRKATLRSMLAKAGLGLRFNEHLEGDGSTVFAHACKMGLKGIVFREKTDDGNLRNELVQQLESLSYRGWTKYGNSRGIAARSVKARYQGFPHGVAVRGEHNRNRLSSRLCHVGRRLATHRSEHRDLPVN
jgi:bifunctional non-homologous end joining protein LigD